MVGYCLRNNNLVVSSRVTALGCIFGVTSGWGGKGANAQCAEERRNFACYAVASHSKLLTLLHHKVAMDYLGRHKRTAHTHRNLCPK